MGCSKTAVECQLVIRHRTPSLRKWFAVAGGATFRRGLTCCPVRLRSMVAERSSNLNLPKGGCVVILSKSPDWFSIRLNTALAVLGVK